MTSAKSFSAERNKGKLDLSVGPTVIEGVHHGLGSRRRARVEYLDLPHGADTNDDEGATWDQSGDVAADWHAEVECHIGKEAKHREGRGSHGRRLEFGTEGD